MSVLHILNVSCKSLIDLADYYMMIYLSMYYALFAEYANVVVVYGRPCDGCGGRGEPNSKSVRIASFPPLINFTVC